MPRKDVKPKGYWSEVFYRTTVKLRAQPGLKPDDAFLMVRNEIDSEQPQLALDLPAATPEPLTLVP